MAGLLIVVILVLTFAVQAVLASRFDWRCDKCGKTFSIPPLKAALLPHRWGGQKLIKCPSCGVRSWVRRVPKETRASD
ncbi:MAG: hypothetical protein WA359_07235 [Acidimicrobiales bacterium]